MSILTKVFIFLVLFVAMVKLGMDATLFSQRIDWKDKFVKSENWRIEIERVKNEEIGEKNVQIENLMTGIDILKAEKDKIEEEKRGKETEIEGLKKELDRKQEDLRLTIARLEKEQHLLSVQIEMAMSLQKQLQEQKDRADQAVAARADAEQKLMEAQQQLNVIRVDMADLEKKLRQLYVELRDVQGALAAYREKFGDIPGAIAQKLVNGKVLSYSRELSVVVINVGEEDGVKEGMEFTISRPGKYVATAMTKRISKKLTVAEIKLMNVEPIPGDECTTAKMPMVNK